MNQTLIWIHCASATLEMKKNFSMDFNGATRTALLRALKWAPTWYVWADTPTFTSYPDLIQRLGIKGILEAFWKSAQTYHVGAHFKALDKGILVTATKMLEKFFHFKCLWGAVNKTCEISVHLNVRSKILTSEWKPWRAEIFSFSWRFSTYYIYKIPGLGFSTLKWFWQTSHHPADFTNQNLE